MVATIILAKLELTLLTSVGKLTDFFLCFLLDGKIVFIMLFDGAFNTRFGVVGIDLIVCKTAACSSFDLKQFEHKSFFHAFWINRGHCVTAIDDIMCKQCAEFTQFVIFYSKILVSTMYNLTNP